MISITTCVFQVNANDKWRNGFAIVDGIGGSTVMNIIDENAIVQAQIWDYKLDPANAEIVYPMSLIHKGMKE